MRRSSLSLYLSLGVSFSLYREVERRGCHERLLIAFSTREHLGVHFAYPRGRPLAIENGPRNEIFNALNALAGEEVVVEDGGPGVESVG